MITTEYRSGLMKRVRQSGTAPELVVRGLLTEIGARYRLNVRGLPGRLDIANKTRQLLGYRHLPSLRAAIQKELGIIHPDSQTHAAA